MPSSEYTGGALIRSSTPQILIAPACAFTGGERCALTTLRERYRQGGDHFDERELAHLRFLRWLVQTGRLIP